MSFREIDSIDRMTAGFDQLATMRQILTGTLRTNFRLRSSFRPYSVNHRLRRIGYQFDADVAPATEYYVWLHSHKVFICAYCICIIPESERSVDHMIPLSKGGRHRVDNLVPACLRCNNQKHNRPARKPPTVVSYLSPEAWLADRGTLF